MRGSAVLVLAGILLSSCAAETPEAEKGARIAPTHGSTLDLVNLFPLAEVRAEAARIDFGTPGARRFLVEGWGYDETFGRWPTAWALGKHSTIRFFLDAPKPITLGMDCWGLRSVELPLQRMTVEVNGHEVGRLELGVGPGTEHRVEVPVSALVDGENVAKFHYAYSARPFEVFPQNGSARPLAANWRQLVFEGAADAGLPEAHPATEKRPPVLRLPFASRLDYYLDLPSGGDLVLDGLRLWGEETAEGWALEVTVTGVSGEPKLYRTSALKKPLRFDLGAHAEPVRLSLRAKAGSLPASPAGVLLVAPRVVLGGAPEPENRAEAAEAEGKRRPNILLYVIDTLRADHLGCYGYDRPTSPHIDALARDSVVFEQAVAQSSWTRPAMASLLSGLYPPRHGANGDLDALPETVRILPEVLQELGYETAGVVTNGVVSGEFGFERGYDFFRLLPARNETAEIHQLSDKVYQVAVNWLSRRNDPKPFFLYLHTTDPHAPYVPRPAYARRFAANVADPSIGLHERVEALNRHRGPVPESLIQDLMSLYDAEIAMNDANFGALVDWLKRQGLYEDTLIVLISDHGEEFHDHGRWQHGLTLYSDQVRVPFLLKLPGNVGAGLRLDVTAQQVDLVPTLADYLSAEPPPEVQGRSLLPAIREPAAVKARPAFSYLARRPDLREIRSVVDGDLHLIDFLRYDRPHAARELYDLRSDPGEKQDLSWERPVRTGFLRSRLRAAFDSWRRRSAERATISPELEKTLKTLGYIE